MGHAIQGLVGRTSELTELLSGFKTAYIIPLAQEFAFVPMTNELYDELLASPEIVGGEFLADVNDERFIYLSSKMFQIGRAFSKKTPVALIETDYFGGDGFQRGVAWKDGDYTFGPYVAGNEEGFTLDGKTLYPVNWALSEIGAQGYLLINDEAKDEFEELGLDKYRSNEAWIESIQNAD